MATPPEPPYQPPESAGWPHPAGASPEPGQPGAEGYGSERQVPSGAAQGYQGSAPGTPDGGKRHRWIWPTMAALVALAIAAGVISANNKAGATEETTTNATPQSNTVNNIGITIEQTPERVVTKAVTESASTVTESSRPSAEPLKRPSTQTNATATR
jgi:hypothetical protein